MWTRIASEPPSAENARPKAPSPVGHPSTWATGPASKNASSAMAAKEARRASTRLRFAVAGLAVGAAGLIKPMSVFITVPVLGMLALIEPLPWKQRIQAGAELLLVSMLAPLLFYGYSATMGSLVQDQMKMRFEPQLISTPFFWNGLGRMISRAETVPLFVLALLGVAIARDRVAR